MKKIFIGILSIVFIATLFTGCFNSVENTPKGVTEAYFKSLNDGDIDSFKKYSSQKHQDLVLGFVRLGCKKDSLSDCFEDLPKDINNTIKDISVVTENATNATLKVSYYNEKKKKSKTEDYKLAKINGNWKVDNSK